MKSLRFVGRTALAAVAGWFFADAASAQEKPRSVSGVYPHLAMYNNEGECGTGAVVPWAGKLWVVTYAPHAPKGSSDKLYEITPELQQIVRPESVGGTPANRMIHAESKQLFIGPYVIDAEGKVRVLQPSKVFGRFTGNARHLTDPAGKIYVATMEEGLYEVDVKTLEAVELWADEQKKEGRHADLPGYHGKGLYSGQGRIVYANNGDHAKAALSDPATPSGVLAEWDGKADHWTVVRRNQFTEVTGPDGIDGAKNPSDAPIWAVGWDHRSLLLQSLDHGKWSVFRLPKGSHSYDGAHGWNTEWPRIRDVSSTEGGEASSTLLMTMHGTFYSFPRGFTATTSAGIKPRSNYLKVVGDFCRWQDQVVLGCDDTAKNEFLNKRVAKGEVAGPGRSQSNLWFLKESQLDGFGPAIGRGAVWLNEAVAAGKASDPFLFSGYAVRTLHLSVGDKAPAAGVKFTLEVDREGDGKWTPLREAEAAPGRSAWIEFAPAETGAWVRITASVDCPDVVAFFHYKNTDDRNPEAAPEFAALSKASADQTTGGLLHARGQEFKTMRYLAQGPNVEIGLYDLGGDLKLKKVDDPEGAAWMRKNVAIPHGAKVLSVDAASVLYVDKAGRWRIPKGDAAFDRPGPLGYDRVCREVCTERDLFNAHGTVYELPAENAGGFSKVRPVATHNRRIHDFATFRGLLVLSGLEPDSAAAEHVVRSDDGACALWVGAVDDLWKLGKPRGVGGPWKDSAVKGGVASDPYLMTGYDKKKLSLSHDSAEPLSVRVEVDVAGTGKFTLYREFEVPAGKPLEHAFPDAFSAYWVRVVPSRDATASAVFTYE